MTIAEKLRAEGHREGRAKGREEGREIGALLARRATLEILLRLKFGRVSPDHSHVIANASSGQLDSWLALVLTESSIERVLNG